MMTSSNICRHFEFFYETKDNNMLVIMHAKFEVNNCCGWDFRHAGGKFTPCTNGTIDTCTIGLKDIYSLLIMYNDEVVYTRWRPLQ